MKHYFPRRRLRRIFECAVSFVLAAVFAASPALAAAHSPEEALPAETEMLARAVASTAGDEEFAVQVSLCAVWLNRVCDGGFPDTLAAVISDHLSSSSLRLAFADAEPTGRNVRAAAAALRGSDPTRGALFFARSGEVSEEVRESGRISFEFGGFAFWK